MSERPRMKRTCEGVQARLPRVVDGTMSAWRGRLLLRHVARCADCGAELGRQRRVAEGLRELGEATSQQEPPPPDDLLDTILERVTDPGIRARAAGPARGAVSGARPELSVGAVVLSALLLYLVWRLVRALVARLDPDRGGLNGRPSPARCASGS